jgi:hypothetical protein
MPSVQKYNKYKEKPAGVTTNPANTDPKMQLPQKMLDNCYHELGSSAIIAKDEIILISDTSTKTITENYSYARLTIPAKLIKAVEDALKTDANTVVTTKDISDALLKHYFQVDMTIVGSAITSGLAYTGYIDKYFRLISETGQVLLVHGEKDKKPESGGSGGPPPVVSSDKSYKFYKPIMGMDINFEIPDINSVPDVATAGGGGGKHKTIKDILETVYKDLVQKLNFDGPPDAIYALVETNYPKYLYTPVEESVDGVKKYNQGNRIGVVFGERNATTPVVLNEYNVKLAEQQINIYKRKIKTLESKIGLVSAIVKANYTPAYNRAGQSADKNVSTIVNGAVEAITKYNALVQAVKVQTSASRNQLTQYKKDCDTAIATCLDSYNSIKTKNKSKIVVTAILSDSLPAIGTQLSLPTSISNSSNYKVISVTVSGVTMTIAGEDNA